MSNKNNAKMNKELEEWIAESKEDIKKNKSKKDYSNVKPKGKCQICGERKAITVCLKCGRNVCKTCHFKIIGVCKKCIPVDISGKWDGSKKNWEDELGVEWVG